MLGGLSITAADLKLPSGNWSVNPAWKACLDAQTIASVQQTHFHQCSSKFPEIGCEMFSNDYARSATTMSLSILVGKSCSESRFVLSLMLSIGGVVIEMLNACNSLSENESLLVMPIWVNPYLVASIALSMALHFMILYVPFLSVSGSCSYSRCSRIADHCTTDFSLCSKFYR